MPHHLTRLTLLIFIFMLAHTQHVEAWSLFGPSDYEECSDEAAKEAKGKNALKVMLKNCNSKFRARRKPGGGYIYCANIGQPTFQKICIDVNGPKISHSDQNRMLAKAERVNAEARSTQEQLRRLVTVKDWKILCQWVPSFESTYNPVAAMEGEKVCWPNGASGTIVNNSDYSVSEVGLGLILGSGITECSGNLRETNRLVISIPPHQLATFSFNVTPKVINEGTISGCLKVTSAIP